MKKKIIFNVVILVALFFTLSNSIFVSGQNFSEIADVSGNISVNESEFYGNPISYNIKLKDRKSVV